MSKSGRDTVKRTDFSDKNDNFNRKNKNAVHNRLPVKLPMKYQKYDF